MIDRRREAIRYSGSKQTEIKVEATKDGKVSVSVIDHGSAFTIVF